MSAILDQPMSIEAKITRYDAEFPQKLHTEHLYRPVKPIMFFVTREVYQVVRVFDVRSVRMGQLAVIANECFDAAYSRPTWPM